jgi:hypothetical protein
VTLSEIEQDVYRRTGKNTSSPDTVTQTRVRAFINQRQRRILSDVGIGRLRDDVFTFSSVASQQRYGLPQGISKLHRIIDSANGRSIRLLTLAELREVDPRASTYTGTPDYVVPVGYSAVASQPSDASQIWAVSTSASDTQNLTIETALSTGERRTITQALTGTVPVQIGTLSTHVVIERIYVATAAVGTITILEDSGTGAELSRITIGQTAPRYFSILLYPTPSAVVAYTVDAEFEINDMSIAGDVPYLPPDFHYLLSVGARLDEYEKTDDPARRKIAEREWADGIVKLKWHLYGLASATGTRVQRSNLGAFYPPGVW